MRRNGKLAVVKTFVTCLIVLFASALVYGGSLQEEFDRLCVHTQDIVPTVLCFYHAVIET